MAANKKVRAAHTLKSWLLALGIPYEERNRYTVVVNGKKFEIGVDVSADDLLSKDVQIVRNTVSSIIVAAGYEPPKFVDRGKELPPKSNYKNHYEDVYLRTRTLQRTPNPPNELLKKYDPIVKKVAHQAYYKYSKLATAIGFTVEDFITIGRVHLITFLHFYAYEKSEEAVCKALYMYLWQRFNEWGLITDKKVRSLTLSYGDTFGNYESSTNDEGEDFNRKSNIPSNGHSPDDEYEVGDYYVEYKDTGKQEFLYVRRNGLLDLRFVLGDAELTGPEIEELGELVRTGKVMIVGPIDWDDPPPEIAPESRRRAAQRRLLKLLKKMDKEQLRYTLGAIAVSYHFDHDVREVASRLCKKKFGFSQEELDKLREELYG